MFCLTILFAVEPEGPVVALPDPGVATLRVRRSEWLATGTIWKRHRMETEGERSDRGEEMIRLSGEPS